MRVTKELIGRVIKEFGKDHTKLKSLLLSYFSDPVNIDVFSQTFFPEAIHGKVPKFHQELYKELLDEKNNAFAAPRGHAKSTIAGLVFIIYSVVYNLEQYIVYVSQNHAKTVQFLTPLRWEFKNNELLKFVYGDLTPKSGRDDDGKDREDCFDVNNIRIEAVSFEKNLRGFKYKNIRPTLIIGDDIESDERVINPDLRLKDEQKLNKVIIPALDIDGRFKFIGTILHLESLLSKKIKQYKGKIYTACKDDFTDLLWPERFTKDKLLEIKKEIGSLAFQQEYMNNPIDDQTSLIKREWINRCFREDLSLLDLEKKEYSIKVMGADFAFSDRITADESAFVSLGSKDDYYYLFHCEKFKGWSVQEQLNHIKNSLHPKYSYDQVGLEENSIKAVSKDLSQYNLPITLFWTAAADPSKTKTSYNDYEYFEKRHTVGKINLIMRLGTAFENKRFIIPYKTEKDKQVADRILAECTSFALSDGKLVEAGVHPDIPIGMGYALELINSFSDMVVDFG